MTARCYSTTIALFFACAMCGCAYYNGLYNANQRVKEALRAEREGRVGEARSLWSQAAVKAESVSVRYPDSRYHDDALLLRGRALFESERWESAIEPLTAAIRASADTLLLEKANLLLGRCYLVVGRADSAIAAFSRALPSNDTMLAAAAHLWRGRAHATLGEHKAAVMDLNASFLTDAAFDLAISYARLGWRTDAERVLRWRVNGEYIEPLWLATLDSVGTHFPEMAAGVVDRLLERPGLSRSEEGVLLMQDAKRWDARGEDVRATARYQQVLDLRPSPDIADAARYGLILSELRRTDDLERLPSLLDSLATITSDVETMRPAFADVWTAVEASVVALEGWDTGDSAIDSWRSRNPDLELFLAAEALRDKADTRTPAVALFEAVAIRHPRSPLAPKALLAAAVLQPPLADSILEVVRASYPRSPYTLVLEGDAHREYAALEDSLRTLILSKRGAT